jgi:menaquinone-9 beta-reductase
MHNEAKIWDVAIIGGGLAGLAAAIQLADNGFDVVLLEKESYPYHKVCGEYISMESWNFLQALGVPLQDMQLPLIKTLQLSAPNGKLFQTLLPMGGFGISRYTLDHKLAALAREKGILLLEEARADEVVQKDKTFEIAFTQKGVAHQIKAKLAAGAFGKRSNLDVKWKRPFISNAATGQNNYIGIKYHVKTAWPQDVIGLHNFKDGYCGLSKIEGDKYCLCYLTTAKNLKENGGSVKALEEQVLYRNKHLKSIFENSEVAEGFPVSIAQISFRKKGQVENGVLLLGDSAGMITPLCGNGMSMALHSSKIAAALMVQCLKGLISQQQMQQLYTQQWQQQFSGRLAAGRLLQQFFGREWLSNLFVQAFVAAPFLAGSIIKKTHGKPF